MRRGTELTASRSGQTIRLIVLLDGNQIGQVLQDRRGTLQFTYHDEWRLREGAYPLSLSMPLSVREHSHDIITAFLWGLLPDNSRTLDHYGRIFGVSSANPVALLTYLGADCAGAVQFAPPEGVEALLGSADSDSDVEWLTEEEVAAELRTVRDQGIPGMDRRTVGQFSLAGAQPKIALLEENGRWGRPRGRIPTNRILKPPSKEFHGFAENEHFCLQLAGLLELSAVHSRVLKFSEELTIVVDRFDRQKRGYVYYRIHQEDTCQALGIMPTRKYENEGGPGVREIVGLLRDASRKPDEDVDRFLKVTALGWVISATDGHAKNYALLHGSHASTRLAPFYDIASYLPYSESSLHRVKLAMKIGSQYLVRRINRSHWEALARSIGLPVSDVLDRVESVVESIATLVDVVRQAAIAEGLEADFIHALADRIRERAAQCLSVMRPTAPDTRVA